MRTLFWSSVAGLCHGVRVFRIATMSPLRHTDLPCVACAATEPWDRWEKKATRKAYSLDRTRRTG